MTRSARSSSRSCPAVGRHVTLAWLSRSSRRRGRRATSPSCSGRLLLVGARGLVRARPARDGRALAVSLSLGGLLAQGQQGERAADRSAASRRFDSPGRARHLDAARAGAGLPLLPRRAAIGSRRPSGRCRIRRSSTGVTRSTGWKPRSRERRSTGCLRRCAPGAEFVVVTPVFRDYRAWNATLDEARLAALGPVDALLQARSARCGSFGTSRRTRSPCTATTSSRCRPSSIGGSARLVGRSAPRPADLMTIETSQTTLVLGGGPAGLTAGYLLERAGRDVVVLEADDQVGGLAKTVERDGYRFDLGGHRFFTKSLEVDTLWHEILGDEFLLRPRMSRIYWNNRFLDYPLRGADVIRKLGPIELTRCMASYLRAAARRNKVDDSLEDWVSNRFGRRLFELFFKSYTEKVWGVPTSEIRAEWAAQRIKGLSFFSAGEGGVLRQQGQQVKSLISEFNYPRFGPGPDVGGDDGRDRGARAARCASKRRVVAHRARRRPRRRGRGRRRLVRASRRRDLVAAAARRRRDGESGGAAGGARGRPRAALPRLPHASRSSSTVRICSPTTGSTSTSRRVRVGRIQNFRSWSPWMVPDPDKACVGLEYFCFEGDDLWTMADDAARRARVARARAAAARTAVEGRARLRDPRAEGVPDLRRATTPSASRRSAAGSTGSRTCSRSAATGCTATTTRTTRC